MSEKSNTAANEKLVKAFVDAFNRHDADGIMSLMSKDCVFESSVPAPDGARVVGAEQVRNAWLNMFKNRPSAHFDEEETFVAGDRAFSRWRLSWETDNGRQHVRGIDVMRIKDGLIVEKLTYSKK